MASNGEASKASAQARPNLWVRFSHAIDSTLVNFYYKLGHRVSDHTVWFVVVPILITGLCLIGLANFDVENDGEQLYTPQDSVAFEQRDIVDTYFAFEDSRDYMFGAAKSGHGNVLTKAALLDFLTAVDILFQVNITSGGEIKNMDNTCRKISNSSDICDMTSVLDFWDYNRTLIETDPDVVKTVNDGLRDNATDAIGRPLDIDFIFGGIEATGNDIVTTVKAFQLRFLLKSNTQRVNGDMEFDTALQKFEVEASKAVRKGSYNVLDVTTIFQGDLEKESENAINADVGLLIPGYVVLIIFTFLVMCKPTWVGSYGSMAFASIFCIVLAIGGALGLGLGVGVKFSLVVQALAFLLLGLGVDDSFVVMAAHAQTDSYLSVRERVARTMARAGVSITITSVTDVAAFAVGTITSLPAIRDFCTYAAIGILFDFFLQLTVFVACLAYNTKRENSGRADIFCCYKPREPQKLCCSSKQYDPNGKTSLDKFFGDFIPKIILHPVGKAAVLIIALALGGTGIWASQQVTTRFKTEWFIPDNSHVWDALDVQKAYFGGTPYSFSYYSQEADYPALQPSMDSLVADFEANQYIIECFPWWTFFKGWMQANKNVTSYANEADFYPFLYEWLETESGSAFAHNIILDPVTNNITIAKFSCDFVDVFEDNVQVEAMEAAREIANDYPALDGFSYDFGFMFIDGQRVIAWETLRNVIVAGVVVAVVTFIMLANAVTSLCVVLMLALTDLNVLAMMYYTNVDFNSVSAINLVIAVGLAIDSSVHIAHAFLTSVGTRDQRAKRAMEKLGKSAFFGIFSTFLAIVLLSAAQSYIFQVFFKVLSSILLFALFHGVFVLPVVLSLIGPKPFPSWELHDDDELNNKINESTNGKSDQKPSASTKDEAVELHDVPGSTNSSPKTDSSVRVEAV